MHNVEKTDSATKEIISDLQNNLDQLAALGYESTAIFSDGGRLHKISGVASGDFGPRIELVSDHSHLVQKNDGDDAAKIAEDFRYFADKQRAIFSAIIAVAEREDYAKLIDISSLATIGIELTERFTNLRDCLAPD